MPDLLGSAARFLMAAGLILAAAGGLLLLLGRLPFDTIPRDIRIDWPGWRLHFPLGSMVVVSVVLNVILNLVLTVLRRSG